MVKKSRPAQKTQTKPAGDRNVKLPDVGLPKKRIIKQVDNNVVYGAGALLLLGGGYYAFSQGWFNNLPFVSTLFTPAVVTNVMVTPNMVPQGTTATATGAFAKAAPTTFYSVFNSIGTSVLNGTLGTNVTTFSTSLATNTLPLGTYTIVISDQPISGPPAGAITGQPAQPVLGVNTQLQDVFTPTSTTLQQSASSQSTGASGPSNISLS